MKKLDTSVFLKAANQIGNPDAYYRGCCLNIAFFAGVPLRKWDSEPHVNFFDDLFNPKTNHCLLWYGNLSGDDNLARQLGLLLCAEVLKDEQRKRK